MKETDEGEKEKYSTIITMCKMDCLERRTLQAALAEKEKELADYKDATNISPAAIEEWIKKNAEDKKRIEELENAIDGNLSNKRREIGLLDTEIDSFKAKLASAEKVAHHHRETLAEIADGDQESIYVLRAINALQEMPFDDEAALAEHDKEKP